MFLFVFNNNNSGAFHTRGMLKNELYSLNQLLKSIGTENGKNPHYFNPKNYWRVKQCLKKMLSGLTLFQYSDFSEALSSDKKKGFVGSLPVCAACY